MDTDGFEDMLFDFPSSQDTLDDVWEIDSQDEEMLDAPFDSGLTSWDLSESPELAPTLTCEVSDKTILHAVKDVETSTDHSRKLAGHSPIGRDR